MRSPTITPPYPTFPPHSPYLRRISPPGSPGTTTSSSGTGGIPTSSGGGSCKIGSIRCCYQPQSSSEYSTAEGPLRGLCCCCCYRGTKRGGRGKGTSVLATLGVCCLVLGYTVVGAFVFMALEGGLHATSPTTTLSTTAKPSSSPNAQLSTTTTSHHRSPAPSDDTSPIGALRTQTVDRLWSITENLNILYRENWTRLAAEEVYEFQEALFRALRASGGGGGGGYSGGSVWFVQGHGGAGPGGETHRWSFTSSFLYSLTLITTIGYGSVSPRTTWGKLVTILYALIGIPLMLLYLSTTGDILARSFRRLYGKLCGPNTEKNISSANHRVASNGIKTPMDGIGGGQCPCGTQQIKVPVTLCLVIVLAYIGSGAFLFQRLENWSLLEGSYFCFTSLGTIGFGDLLPGQHHTRQQHISLFACSAYILTGMALVAMCFTLVQDEILALLRLVTTTTNSPTHPSHHNHHSQHLPHCYCQQQIINSTSGGTNISGKQTDIA